MPKIWHIAPKFQIKTATIPPVLTVYTESNKSKKEHPMTPTQHTVLITGGATGIGFALAKKFYAAGNRVILVGRREDALRQAVEQLSGSLHDNGARCGYAVADVSQAEDRARLAAQFPETSILINNAGIQFTKRLDEQTDDEIAQEIAVNLTAPVQLTRAFLPVLANRRPPSSTCRRAWRWCPRKPAPFTAPPKPHCTAFRKCCAGSWKTAASACLKSCRPWSPRPCPKAKGTRT